MPSAECRQILGGQKRVGVKVCGCQSAARHVPKEAHRTTHRQRPGHHQGRAAGRCQLWPACTRSTSRWGWPPAPVQSLPCLPRPRPQRQRPAPPGALHAAAAGWHLGMAQAAAVGGGGGNLVRGWCRSTQCQSACPSGRMHHKDLFNKYAPTALTDRAFAGSPLSMSLTWSSAPDEELQPRARRHLLHCW